MAERRDRVEAAIKRALLGPPDAPSETAEDRAARLRATWPRTMTLLADVLTPDGRVVGYPGALNKEGIWLTAIERILEQLEDDRG